MRYSPKLKVAKQEIEAILKKHDIGAIVMLHTPGFGESLYRLDPGYGAAELSIDGSAMVLKGKLEHYNGDKKKRDEAVAASINMLRIMTDVLAPLIVALGNTVDEWEKFVETTHSPTTFTPDTEIDN